MSDRSVVHDTFTLQRTYDTPPNGSSPLGPTRRPKHAGSPVRAQTTTSTSVSGATRSPEGATTALP